MKALGTESRSCKDSQTLVSDLHTLLLDLSRNPYPHVPNPPNCTKRASVACILRIKPTYPDIAEPSTPEPKASFERRIASFFSQAWVRRGDPEVLFIKRSARKGDRFTSHVAFPGGKRDPEDSDDYATSVRETMEEVGLDVSAEHALFAGNLPERIVSAEWGKVPILVLSPFVFLLTKSDTPPLVLQPSEVHSAHWVPLRALLAPSLKTFERADVSDRVAGERGWIARAALQVMLGQMLYAATRLIPSESVYSSSSANFIPEENSSFTASLQAMLSAISFGDHAGSSNPNRPLLLWGLTYGVVVDLLDLLPSQEMLKSWSWPTFSAPDVKLAIWLVSYRFRKEKMIGVRQTEDTSPAIIGEDIGVVSSSMRLGVEGTKDHRGRVSRSSAVENMLKGYHKFIRRAVIIAFVARFSFGAIIGIVIMKRIIHRRSQVSLSR